MTSLCSFMLILGQNKFEVSDGEPMTHHVVLGDMHSVHQLPTTIEFVYLHFVSSQHLEGLGCSGSQNGCCKCLNENRVLEGSCWRLQCGNRGSPPVLATEGSYSSRGAQDQVKKIKGKNPQNTG